MVDIPELKIAKHYIKMVIDGYLNSVLLTSEGGLGKSYLTIQTLEDEKQDDYVYFSGHISPLSLFKMLYDNFDKTIVLDDVEQLFESKVSIGILKSALWEVGGKRLVCYATTSEKADDVPCEFEFEGGLIILCNKIPNKNDEIVRALQSRTLKHHIKLTYAQKIKIMKRIIDNRTDLNNKDKEILKKDIVNHTSICVKDFNLRTLEKLIQCYKYNQISKPKKEKLYLTLFENTTEVDEEKILVLKLMKKYKKTKKQIKYFNKITGKSRRTFFRIKKKIMEESI